MSTKFSDVIDRVSTLLGSDSSLTDSEIASIVQTRYETIYETFHWSKRRRDFMISLVPLVSSGTSDKVTVTNGSANVVSVGTPFTIAMTGRQFKVGSERQYFFVNYVSASTITLQDGEGMNVTWPGATASDESWSVFQTLYQLPTDCGDILTLVGAYPLDEMDGGRSVLDEIDPDRLSTNTHPTHWVYAGADRVKATREIEIWPVPTTGRVLRGQYNREAPILGTGSIIDVPTPVLVYAAAADGCHILHAKQGSTELMWENKALFFERKSQEVVKDYKIADFEMTSPPNHLMKVQSDRRTALRGTDYEISHDLDTP